MVRRKKLYGRMFFLDREMWKLLRRLFIFIFFILSILIIINKTHLKTLKSETNNQIVIYYKDAFLFGSTEIKVYYKKDSMIFEKKLFSTSIETDGAPPTEDSVRYSWKDNVCSITLISSEGKSKDYQIIFGDEVVYR